MELVKALSPSSVAKGISKTEPVKPIQRHESFAGAALTHQNVKSDEPTDANFFKKAHPLFHRFFELKGRVLLRASEEDERERLLMDKELQEKAFDLIFNIEEQRFDLDSEIQRLYAVDFLDSTIEWRDNPTRGKVIARLADKLELEEAVVPQDHRLYASIMMDRVELLMSLVHHQPELLSRLSNPKSRLGQKTFATALNQWREMAVLDIENRANNAIRKKLSKNGRDRDDQVHKGAW